MSAPVDRDPPRWRDVRPSTTDGEAAGPADVERDIGAASRSVTAAPGPDELRLAQVRQRALQHAERARQVGMRDKRASLFFGWEGGPWRWSHWARLGPVVFVSLLVGGVATAVTGRLIQRYGAAPAPSTPAAAPADNRAVTRGARHRRWRVTVKSPTNLELAVGPDGAEIAVVEGQANMSGEGITDSVEVLPGKSWKEGDSPLPVPTALPPAPMVPGAGAPPPVRTLARAETMAGKARGNGPRATTTTWGGGVTDTSSGRIGEAPPPSPFQPPPLPPLALPLAPARPAKISQPRLWGGSDVEPGPRQSAEPAPAPSAPVATVGEATLVARALGRLRREHDPLWALQDLDEHARAFPRGELRREASLARAEALLALDRRIDALAILDGVRLSGAETERSVALARAELRVQEGRHGEAIGDFDRVLVGSAGDALSERALFGRGLCRLRGGDLGGARADLNAHLERFPSSHRRGEIEKVLGRIER
jgi:hypothetical protein